MIKDRQKQGISCTTCSFGYLCLAKDLSLESTFGLDQVITQTYLIEKGQHIYHQDQKMNAIFALYNGYAKEYWLDEDGNEFIDNFYFPGDMLGLESLPLRKHALSAVALTDVTLCIIPIDAFLRLMHEDSDLAQRYMHINSFKMLNNVYRKMTTNAKARVANFLLNIFLRGKERHFSDNQLCLPMSQIDMSNFLGMAYETVNRILHGFHHQDIIHLNSKEISIQDVDQLKKMASPFEVFGQE